jgi:hypothetical protein
MTYVNPNFKTKKALKEAVKARLDYEAAKNDPMSSGITVGDVIGKSPREIEVYEPGLGSVPTNGTVYLEGPHYPEPHKWYAKGTMKDGRLVKVV